MTSILLFWMYKCRGTNSENRINRKTWLKTWAHLHTFKGAVQARHDKLSWFDKIHFSPTKIPKAFVIDPVCELLRLEHWLMHPWTFELLTTTSGLLSISALVYKNLLLNFIHKLIDDKSESSAADTE